MSSVKVWAKWHAFLLLPVFGLAMWGRSAFVLSLVGLLSFIGYIVYHQRTDGILSAPANWMTLARVSAVFLIGLTHQTLSPLVLFLVGLTILLTDFADGYLAKHFQTESQFGAYFDMETDAIFIGIFSVILFADGYLPIWVVGLGLLRYVYLALLVVLRQDGKPEPRFFAARFVAVMVMISVLAPFILGERIYRPFVLLTTILVLASFIYTFFLHVSQPTKAISNNKIS